MIKVKKAGLAGTIAAFWVILAAIAAYNFAARPWYLNWGTTPQERTRALLGDDAWIGGVVTGTRAVTVQAPPEKVWSWLIQIGQDRAGFYSYTWLENLTLADIHNTYEIRPEWQTREPKDLVRAVKPDYLFGLPKKTFVPGWKVSFTAPDKSLTLREWGTFALEPDGSGGTRFFARSRGGPLPGVAGRLASFWLLDAAHFIMEKRMMLEIKRLAEGRPGPPRWVRALATAGFLAAVVGSTMLIGSKKRRREFWLLLPLFAAVIILQQTSDVPAALTGFTALALAIIGFLYLRKRWWIYFGLLLIYSYAVLFLAADAWIVFGLVFLAAFALLAAAALKGMRAR